MIMRAPRLIRQLARLCEEDDDDDDDDDVKGKILIPSVDK